MSRPTQHTSESSHRDKLSRVRKSLEQYRDNREILVQCLKATDILIKQTHDEYQRLLRNFQANNPKSYIDTLPNEVLMDIFKIVCEESSDFHTGNMGTHQFFRPPIAISTVSSRWRTISLSQRELWRAFGTRLDEGRNAANASQRSVFRRFLQRSNGLPMDLWFASTMLNLEAGPTVLHDALSCPHRVRRLAIFFEAGSANRTVERLIKSDWPYMETLEIYVGRQAERFDLPVTTLNGGEGLAKLTQLRSNTDFFIHIPQRNLSQLTTIQMERCFRSVTKYPWLFLLNLARIPTLVEFSVAGDLFRNPTNAVQEPVVAKNLKYFRCSDEIVAQRMWTDITFPKLQLLVLQTVNLGAQRFPYNVEKYRTQQQAQPVLAPNLRTLVLVECIAGLGPIYRRFLGFATAAVTRLVIVDQREVQTDNVFERLISNSHHTYWPNLEIITYKGNSDEDIPISSPSDLLEFLEGQKTKKPCKLRLCVDQDLLEERESQGNSEDWEKLGDYGRFENVHWEEDVIPWPGRNFFSIQSQVAFNL